MPRHFAPLESLEDYWRAYVFYRRQGGGAGTFTDAEAGLILHYAPIVTAQMQAWTGRRPRKEELVLGLTSLRLSMEAYARGEAFEDYMIDRLMMDVAA